MPRGFDRGRFEREMRAAQRKAQSQARAAQRKYEAEVKREVGRINREIDRANREGQRRIDQHNRKAEQHNKREIAEHNRRVDRANAHNAALFADLNRQLREARSGPRYTAREEALADRIQHAIPARDDREWDTFLSYARIDGAELGEQLRDHLEALGVSCWFDEIAIVPGQSQSLQMDRGLQRARAGVVLLTPAYLVGRFWTERELGALLHKETLIPVLHGVTFDQVKEYSGILPDLAGFETSRDSAETIAKKIAAAVLVD